MKKTIRIVASVLLLALLSISLVGCRQLDELKRKHGVFLDESREEIELRGHIYEKVMERVMFGNAEWETYLITDEYSMNIADKDVPLLLTENYGETARYNSRDEEDPVVLSIYDSRDGKTVDIFYCREDYLDTLKAKMDNVVLDQFYYTKAVYSVEEDQVVYKKKLVPEKTAEVIIKTLERPYDAGKDLDPQTDYLDFSEYKDLRYTDKDLLFTNDINVEICKTSSGEYFIYGFREAAPTEEIHWKKVAAEDKALFEDLFSDDYVETAVW